MNKTVLLSHSGKQHSYHVAYALEKLGFLHKFYTSGYVNSVVLQKMSEKYPSALGVFRRRYHPGIPVKKVVPNWRFEWKEIALARIKGTGTAVNNAVYERDVNFDRFVAKRLSRYPDVTYWGFQGSCHSSLQKARANGITTICELSTAHVTSALKILGEEKRLHPEWADSIDNLTFPAHYQKRLEEEPLLADWVFAASDFTRRSLTDAGVSVHNIKVLPLGCNVEEISFHKPQVGQAKAKLLYAGRITQRKGIKYLLEAMKSLPSGEVELHLIGNMHGDEKPLHPYKHLFQRYPAVSQPELFRLYQKYDLLVLPSVFEGFGLVIVEAMAAGLPVITTANTMGPDIIQEGVNGYLVPIRDAKAVEEAIEKYLVKSPEEKVAMRYAAREASEKYSWAVYEQRLKSLLDGCFSKFLS